MTSYVISPDCSDEHHLSEDEDEFSEEEVEAAIMKYIEMSGMFSRTSSRRMKEAKVLDFYTTSWGRLISDPTTREPKSRNGKLFRRRFRVPFPIFKDVLVPDIIQYNVFETKRSSRIPVEFKILVSLRMMGRDTCADTAKELTGMGESTCNYLLKKFAEGFRAKLYAKYVKIPQGEKLVKIMKTYARLGVPGAIGSMDCTRLKWGICPSTVRQSCTGKEGKGLRVSASFRYHCTVDVENSKLFSSAVCGAIIYKYNRPIENSNHK